MQIQREYQKEQKQEKSFQNELYENENQKKSVTFSEAIDQWIQWKQYSLAISSILKYQNLIEKHIRPELGNISIQEFDYKKLADFLEMKMTEKNKKKCLSSSTLQSILYIIHAVYYFSTEGKQIPGIKIAVKLQYRPIQEVFILSKKEQQKLEKNLMLTLDSSKLGIFICLYTGLRLGEICALKWEDISLKQSNIRVSKTMQRINTNKENKKTELIITSPKSVSSMRTIPIPSILSAILKEFQQKNSCIPEYFLLSGKSEKPIEPRTYEYRFESYLKQAGISHYKFHTLRHTFATNCVRAGVDIKSLSEILGHSDVSITLQKYVHSSFEMKQEQLEKICVIRGQELWSE